MRRFARQLLIPVLISFSLTGVSLAVLYLLHNKDEKDKRSRGKQGRSELCTSEYRIPRQFVPAVIGRAGTVLQNIQSATRTQIRFKEDDISRPERACEIKGTEEDVRLAEEMIKEIIVNQPLIETYEMYVPQQACNAIIGRGGTNLQKIQSTSSAKVIVEQNYSSHNASAERRIIIKGTAEQIASAFSQITEKIIEEKAMRAKLEASTASRLPRGKLSPRASAASTASAGSATESAPPRGPSPLQAVDGLMEVYVSAMESPSQFWIQIVGPRTTALSKLVDEMTAYYNEEENREIHVLKNISLGQMVAAKFSFDEQWYRAEVIGTPEEGRCEVYFVDYGDRELLEVSSVLELRTDFLSLRLQAVECSLANVRSRENDWSQEACDRFYDLTWVGQWRSLQAKVRGYKDRASGYGTSRREGSPVPCVELYDRNDDKDVNIGLELINEGLAESDEPISSAASSTLSLSNRSHDPHTFSSPTSTPPLTKRAASPSNERPKTSPLRQIEEIDLISPDKKSGRIEEIDLVTPVKQETGRFIEAERSQNGGRFRNGGPNHEKSRFKLPKHTKFAPAGYESDLSEDSDELELG